jgi:hypothetical protein
VQHQFKPGQSGNPGGKPKGILTNDKIQGVIGRFADMTRDELQAVIQNQKSSMLEITVASILAQAAKGGDYTRLEFLLSRTIGKVKDQLEVSTVKPYIVERLDGTTLELGAKPEEKPE